MLLDFTSPGCHACEQSAGVLTYLNAKYGAKGLVIVGISSNGWDLPAFPFQLLIDLSVQVYNSYGCHGVPTVVLIGPDGRLLVPQAFPWPVDKLEQQIAEGLKTVAG